MKKRIKKYFAIAFFLLFLNSCLQKKAPTNYRIIEVSSKNSDTVISLLKNGNDTLSIFRDLEILENENLDSLNIGYIVIKPRYTGNLYFIQSNLNKDQAIYVNKETKNDTGRIENYSKLFTISIFAKSPKVTDTISKIKIKAYFSEKIRL